MADKQPHPAAGWTTQFPCFIVSNPYRNAMENVAYEN